MCRSRRSWLFAAVIVSVVCPALRAATSEPPSLPSVECVERLRSARLASETGERERSVAILEGAAELPTCEVPAITELLERERALELSETALLGLQRRLAGILADPSRPLPAGTFSFLARLRDLPVETLQLLRDGLAARARATETPPPALLEAKAAVEEQLELWAEARDTLEPLLGSASEDLLWRAVLLDLRLERWESALGIVTRLESVASSAPILRKTRLELLARLGRFEELMAALGELEPGDEVGAGGEIRAGVGMVGDSSPLVDLAWYLRDGGHDAEAEALFRRALELRPEDEELRAVVLHLYGDAEDRSAAVAAREEALAAADADTLYREGTALLAAGDAQGALALLARAAPDLEGSTLAEAAWFNLGLAAYKLERWEVAAEALRNAIELNPGRAGSHYHRGLALYQLERYPEAAASFRRTLSLDPARHDVYYWLSHSLAAIGDDDAAAEAMRRYREAQGGS
jgi:tetratricopeptide (TPR) repeat protein